MRRKPQVVSIQIFGHILKTGGFKKSMYKNRWYQDVYVNEDATFIVVERRIADIAGNPLVAFHFVNAPGHRITATNNAGYNIIHLDKTYTIHKIVAETFLGPTPEGLEIDHIDGDKSRNVLQNLEYVTHSENIRRHYKRAKERGDSLTRIYQGRWIPSTQNLSLPDGTKQKMSFDEYLQYLLDHGRKHTYNRLIKKHNGGTQS